MKLCKCGEVKRDTHGCRKCSNAYTTAYRRKNYSKIREQQRRQRNRAFRYNVQYRWRGGANGAVYYAIKHGTLKPLMCEVCDTSAQAHHDSYLKEDWLNIRWLCKEHHRDWHRSNEPIFPNKYPELKYRGNKLKTKTRVDRDKKIKKLLRKGIARKTIANILHVGKTVVAESIARALKTKTNKPGVSPYPSSRS